MGAAIAIEEGGEARLRAPEYWVDREASLYAVPEPTGLGAALFAVAGVLFATEEGPPPTERLRWLAARTAETVREQQGLGVMAVRAGLLAAQWLAPVLVAKLPPLSRLERFEDRVEALQALERSPLGPALLAIKAVLCIHYFEHPEVAEEVGFDGRCMTSLAGER